MTTSLNRGRRGRGVLAGAVALLFTMLATACGSGAGGSQAGEDLTVGVFEDYSAYLLYVAEDQGFLEENGIGDMTVTMFTSVPAQMTAVSKGQIDVAMQTFPPLLNYNKTASGDDRLKAFSSFGTAVIGYSAAVDNGVAPAEGDDWQASVRTWEGKKIGMPALGGIVENNTRYMVREAGLADDAVTYVAVGGQGAAGAALKQGLVDIVAGGSAIHAPLVEEGVAQMIISADQQPEVISAAPSAAWFTSQGQLNESPEIFEGLVAAIADAREFIADDANRDAAIQVLVDRVKLDPAAAEFVFDQDRDQLADSPMNEETYELLIDSLTATGTLTEEAPGYDDLFADFTQ